MFRDDQSDDRSTWGSIYRIIHYRLKIADLVAETLDERLEEGIERRKQEKKKTGLVWQAVPDETSGEDRSSCFNARNIPTVKQLLLFLHPFGRVIPRRAPVP